ncbi:hypothetical protein EST38_g7117 [Candolleomyces aberdarensis]|uniref:F-box domain-containing protein n=1 Tax=Candolleomyces aberdarensis TaxID=2316362 RepID=A0A4Q2DI40_9AGAR|nr:hypothetical protein EST38_g7117 [Candolleomyces aberdarensis]
MSYTSNQVNGWHAAPVEVQQRVLGHLSVANLGNIGRTSHYHYALVKRQVRGRVTATLADWWLPGETFRFMKDHNMVISGSAVLAIAEPNSVVPNDLDMYVPRGGMPAVQDFLSQHTEYVKVPDGAVGLSEEEQEYASDPLESGVKAVAFFKHPTGLSVLNIIETMDIVATTAIFKFHSTFVMNYVTWNALVCAYPKMTEDRVGLVNTHSLDLPSGLVRCMIKYAVRGFRLLDRAYDWKKENHACANHGYCGRCQRFVGDEYTMRFAFLDGFGVEADVIDSGIGWRLNSRYTCAPRRQYCPMRGFVERTV